MKRETNEGRLQRTGAPGNLAREIAAQRPGNQDEERAASAENGRASQGSVCRCADCKGGNCRD
ncbi:hypothetical protein IDH44_20920 [Paenibacillus sp. IB182496]|uniref:Uncharacterized protein n=1 Tax=Paenibacillus sabuli TaxID=2772509 RepID=A0A927BVL6_9BACL|nr:hypothetical protein [Paenibacillus sabuli]MBD2847661.1 hypothetical protein [Paenibacillus sabuli]